MLRKMMGKSGEEDVNFQKDLEIFTIYDSKVGAYDVPTFAINQHDLVRQIVNMFKDPQQRNNRFLVNAEDYSIFRSGYYSKKQGEIITCTPLEHIVNMHELRTMANADQQGDQTHLQLNQ